MQSLTPLRNAAAGFVVALAAACASPVEAPTEANITDEVLVEAAVVAVDRTTREVTLRGPEGGEVVVVAGPEVRNFDQIDPGDTFRARYVVSLSARKLGPDEPDTEAGAGLAAGRAEAGATPAAGVAGGFVVTVVVKTVDAERHVVTFTDPDGKLHAVEAERDEGRAFVAGLAPGDRVELAYGEALLLSVE